VKKGSLEDEELEGFLKCGWLLKKGKKRWFALRSKNKKKRKKKKKDLQS